MTRRHWLVVCSLLLVIVMVLPSCGATATPTAAPPVNTTAPTAAPAATAVPPTAKPTAVPPTATSAPPPTAAPAVGGNLTYVTAQDPDTLDIQRSAMALMWDVIGPLVGATLTKLAPDNSIVPYACESWKISPDGLAFEFLLKKGVKFHDGTLVTAKDWAYSFTRILDPATKASARGNLGSLTTAEAVDDYTLRLTYSKPYAPALYSLSRGFSQVISKAAVDKGGASYGTGVMPVGAGPYVAKELSRGDRVTLERFADFNWGPAYAHKGPWYIQTFSFKVIPEMATALAGLESGEIDCYFLAVAGKDTQRLKDSGKQNIFLVRFPGWSPSFLFNQSKEPFNDVRVRQAVNYAINREALIQAATQGFASPSPGMVSSTVIGYWPGVEKIAYVFDAAKAKDLLKQAGWTPGADGILAKNGKPMKLKMLAYPQYATDAQILQAQLKDFGFDIAIESVDTGLLISKYGTGDFDFGWYGYGSKDADYSWILFHSSQIPPTGVNYSRVNDPELDALLDAQRAEMDPTKRAAILAKAQQMIVEKAYGGFIYTQNRYIPVSTRVKGVVAPNFYAPYFDDAYISTK